MNDNINDNIIGIFYIATGIYKEYFSEFINTIKYIFPNRIKKLIVISDGLTEYNNMCIGNTNIIVEDFINYPYPYININKLQIVHHYAEKHNINTIVYFDSETYFFEKEESFFDELIEKSKNKFISLTPSFFINNTFRDLIWAMNNYTLWGQPENYNDFDFFYKKYDYDNIDTNYKWIQTSFFMCSFDVLSHINNIMIDIITYNNRIMGLKLNYSDEFYINYLNLYYPELFEANFYAMNNYEKDFSPYDTMFFYQKTKIFPQKMKLKFGNLNSDFRMYICNINSNNELNKFFIEHRNKFLISSINSYTINNKIFFKCLNLDNSWLEDENKNIILEKTFYCDYFIPLYEFKDNLYIGFLNKINEYTNKFDYNTFYLDDYDYIEGYSFNDIKNMKFKDIDMCCFSKRYINAYFNNDANFVPKIYKIN